MYKILFVAAHRLNRSPSQRFRFEQYLHFFKENGFEYKLSYLFSENDDKIFYSEGRFLAKAGIVIKSFFARFLDLISAKQYHIIFIQREAFMTGTTFFESCLKKTGAKIIFDFDDSIWLYDTSAGNKKFEWLKNPSKTAKLIQLADMVFAGNKYLANYALKYNTSVQIIPTTIDTQYHIPNINRKDPSRICIGWTGSITTIKHFKYAIPVLEKIKNKYENKVFFMVIGDATFESDVIEVKGISWQKASEIEDLQKIDIGIMPLPDNDWTKGKCGFKGLQYMALEIPTVMSPVGVNTEIIQDGINGFLASTEEEWIQKLSLLIENKELREKIGKAGRKTVVEKYSVESQKENYLKYFRQLIEDKERHTI